MPIKRGRRRPQRPSKGTQAPGYYRAGDVGFRTTSDDAHGYAVGASSAAPAQVAPTTAFPNAPQFNGRLDAVANVASVGPYRSHHGKAIREIIVPCQFTPGGVQNQYVLLAKNDQTVPKYVRVRLSRNSNEGRIAIGPTAQAGLGGMEWINLVTQSNNTVEFILENGDSIYAIGTWLGVVPIMIQVTVTEWNP